MSTYLFSLVFSDYIGTGNATFISDYGDSSEPKMFRTWASDRSKFESANNFSQTLGPPIIEHFTKLLGIGFAFPKMDQISIPMFKMGAMENWGLITYR